MDEKVLTPPPVLAETLVAHKYPWDGDNHAVGEVYELPASDFEAFLGMGYVRRCEPPVQGLPGESRPGRPHPEPHRGGHPDQGLPGAGTSPPHVDHTLPETPRPKLKKS
jgi:hypothetical protein